MDSMTFNKIAGATIGALLLFLLLNFFSGMIYGTREAAHVADGEHGPVLAYAVAIEGGAAGGGEAEPQIDLLALFEQPDVAAGESVFRACGACHGIEPGANKVGPTLYDVVGADVAHVDSYAYSDAMAAIEGDWTPEHLFAFLENPKAVVPGTKMSYAGLKDPEDRANLIAYLNQLGDTPVDLTEGIEPLAPAAGDAAAEGGAEGGAAVGVGAAADAQGDLTDGPVAATAEAATSLMETGVQGTEVIGQDALDGGAAPVAEVQSEAAAAEAAEGLEVTGVTVVDTSEDNVEVESVVPLEIEQSDPLTTAEVMATDPVEQALTETPVEEHVTVEGPSDAIAVPTGEAVTIEPGAVAPVPAPGAETVVAAAGPAGDAAAGERLFRRCQACHVIEQGVNRVGPHLAAVVGRDIGSVEGFSYSDALAAQEGNWTVEALSAYIENPRAAVPGTKMAFAGLKDEQDRIDLITYLQEAAQ